MIICGGFGGILATNQYAFEETSKENPTKINLFLQDIKDTVSYRHWYFGHYHDNQIMDGGKDDLIYEQIVRLA